MRVLEWVKRLSWLKGMEWHEGLEWLNNDGIIWYVLGAIGALILLVFILSRILLAVMDNYCSRRAYRTMVHRQ